jgi:gamma-glutamyltranspeptidase/glutathione hydrolase
MKNTLRIGIAIMLLCSKSFGQAFNNLPVLTQKPPLHGKHWMAVTGKPLQPRQEP